MAANDALLRLLARGRVQWLATGWEAYLCQQFGIAKQHDWPLAALARLGDRLPVDGAYWMLASPVHLKLQSAPALSTTSISVAAGSDVTPWLPQRDDAQHWRQLLNEMQMLLFSHNANQAMEAR